GEIRWAGRRPRGCALVLGRNRERQDFLVAPVGAAVVVPRLGVAQVQDEAAGEERVVLRVGSAPCPLERTQLVLECAASELSPRGDAVVAPGEDLGERRYEGIVPERHVIRAVEVRSIAGRQEAARPDLEVVQILDADQAVEDVYGGPVVLR